MNPPVSLKNIFSFSWYNLIKSADSCNGKSVKIESQHLWHNFSRANLGSASISCLRCPKFPQHFVMALQRGHLQCVSFNEKIEAVASICWIFAIFQILPDFTAPVNQNIPTYYKFYTERIPADFSDFQPPNQIREFLICSNTNRNILWEILGKFS